MAEASPSIFNKKAAEKLRSPDDLDKYVRVASSSDWAVVAACAARRSIADQEYTGYEWWLARTDDSGWQLVTNGY